jgi:septum formation protein
MKINFDIGGELILASKSPRRKELLTEMGLSFRILTEETDESYPSSLHPRDAAQYLAEKKARAVASVAPVGSVILASDTIVEVDDEPYGKPTDDADAARMLRILSSRAHNVHTGVCVIQGERVLSGVDSTAVHFLPLNEEDIAWYIATREPMDKAGAYGIQGLGGRFISHIEGHMDTVIGLPCKLVAKLLAELTYEEE